MDAFLRAVPDAAKSPYTLIAYLAAVILTLWGGNRLAMVRAVTKSMGAGETAVKAVGIVTNTVVPDKITAEQWIRSNRQRGYFLLAVSIVLVIAAISVVALTRPAANVHIDQSTQTSVTQNQTVVMQLPREITVDGKRYVRWKDGEPLAPVPAGENPQRRYFLEVRPGRWRRAAPDATGRYVPTDDLIEYTTEQVRDKPPDGVSNDTEDTARGPPPGPARTSAEAGSPSSSGAGDALNCTPPELFCPPENTNPGTCADLEDDRANCGQCRRGCGVDRVCRHGSCVLGPLFIKVRRSPTLLNAIMVDGNGQIRVKILKKGASGSFSQEAACAEVRGQLYDGTCFNADVEGFTDSRGLKAANGACFTKDTNPGRETLLIPGHEEVMVEVELLETHASCSSAPLDQESVTFTPGAP
jgi:hypothetical protein